MRAALRRSSCPARSPCAGGQCASAAAAGAGPTIARRRSTRPPSASRQKIASGATARRSATSSRSCARRLDVARHQHDARRAHPAQQPRLVRRRAPCPRRRGRGLRPPFISGGPCRLARRLSAASGVSRSRSTSRRMPATISSAGVNSGICAGLAIRRHLAAREARPPLGVELLGLEVGQHLLARARPPPPAARPASPRGCRRTCRRCPAATRRRKTMRSSHSLTAIVRLTTRGSSSASSVSSW